MARADHGYEGITYNPAKQRFYLLVESRKQKHGGYEAEICEYDDEFRYIKDRPIDFTFKSSNKGFEAVAHVRRHGKDYVLALCEGNKCKSGDKGRKPGGGRVQLFEKKKKRWTHCDTIELPMSVPFVDYSAMTIDNGRVAVVSQVNSMLWVGQFDEADWMLHNAGQLYEFPRTDKGSIRYGNVEGVGWGHPKTHRDGFGQTQERDAARQDTLGERSVDPYLRYSRVGRVSYKATNTSTKLAEAKVQVALDPTYRHPGGPEAPREPQVGKSLHGSFSLTKMLPAGHTVEGAARFAFFPIQDSASLDKENRRLWLERTID